MPSPRSVSPILILVTVLCRSAPGVEHRQSIVDGDVYETKAVWSEAFSWLLFRWSLLADGWEVIKVSKLEGVTYLRRPYQS